MEPNNGNRTNRSYSNYNNSSGGSGSNPNSMSNYPNDMSGAMSSDYGNSTNNRQHHNYDPRFYADAQDHHHDPNIDALLPPLKQIDINQIPPDVLGHLLKTKRIDHLVATTAQRQPQQQQQQQPPQHHQQQQQYTQNNYNNSPYPPQQHQHQQQHQQQSYQGGNPNQSPNPNPLYRQTGGSSSSNTSPANQYPNDWHPGSSSGSNNSSPASYGNTSRSSPRSNVPSNPSAFSPMAKEFSPMAKEFVPRSTYRSPQQRHQQQQQPQQRQKQQQQQGFNVGVYDPNTSYDSGSQNWNQYQTQSGPTSNEFELDNADSVLENITDTITRLTLNPADFQRCSNKTVEILKKYLSDADTLGIVVTLIFEQSISNPNFCYSGARLCQVLNLNNVTVGNQTFKDQLIKRCQEEFANCLKNIQDPQTEKRTLGLTMFLAELYLNFRIEKQGVSAKNHILGAAAAELMTVIANRPPSADNIKCIFQTLKLAGWDLWHESHENVKSQMMKLFQQLSVIGMSYKGKLEPRVEYLLESIFKLKDNDWNKAESSTSEVSGTSSTPNPYKNAEGQDLAESESQFYELPDNVEDDDFNLLIDDEPEDVRNAYEEFLASQNS